MAASATLTYSVNSDGTEFIFNFNVTNNRNLRQIYIEYYGYNSVGKPIMECKTIDTTARTWSYSWKVSSGIVSWQEGYFRIKVTDSYWQVTDTRKNWKENSGQPCDGYLVCWAASSISGNIMKLYAHGSSHYNYPVTYVKFEWSGRDANGNLATGERIVDNILDDFPSIEQDTPCSKNYPGTYKITMKNGKQVETRSGSWIANGTQDTNPSLLSVTSVTVDNSRTTGMKNGKYVVGTKFMIVATFNNRYTTKEVRYVTTGARQGDNAWAISGRKAEAYCTAIAPGEMFVEVIVTDVRGNIAARTLQITIEEEQEDYYAYYFFDDRIDKTFTGVNAQSATITLYNVYNIFPYQSDPKNLTILCYGHKYKKLSEVEKLTHDKLTLSLLKTFTCPNVSGSSQIDIPLSGSDIQKLQGFNGLAFKLLDKNKVTVHGVKCTISMSYK